MENVRKLLLYRSRSDIFFAEYFAEYIAFPHYQTRNRSLFSKKAASVLAGQILNRLQYKGHIDLSQCFLKKSRKPSCYSLFPQLRGCICENTFSRDTDYFDETEIYANDTQSGYVAFCYQSRHRQIAENSTAICRWRLNLSHFLMFPKHYPLSGAKF
jgi:hypothetical protein